ncbi:MAG TPA: sugar ABC transporter permease [Candidatus Eisenbergiella stercorigallinarum]|uniref:Sugar ABC transporter permease n=1 Tax=Candidatus Eisenbergiella stercorigallinarum TaxID=2838557 RepID=A0A9D2R4V4_9FIRM|nr:sugar ABC transporter permease [Candidatus Eisenbergiella stercorigallinarum]
MHMKKRRAKWGLIFCLPFLITFLVFQLYPILYSLYLSFMFQENSRTFYFTGLDNYKDLIQDDVFWKSVANTWKIWLLNFIPQLVSSLLLAILLTQYKIKGATFFRGVFYLPNLITAASIGVLFLALFDWQTGSVNNALTGLGILKEKVNWMSSPVFAQLIVSFIQWLMWFGYSSILLTAGIASISEDIIDASVVDGANAWNRLTRITLPLLKPTILYVLVTSLIGGMQIFDIPMTLTKGSGEPAKSLMTMVLYLYNMAFKYNDLPYGATISYGVFIIIIIFSVIFFKVLYGREDKV